MAKEKFLLVSLSESKAKELAQAISNDTCRKILDYLAEKEATETELAQKLSLPISTVHYNLQQLQKGNLVVVDEFHYSPKGKEVNHYKLANKYIIIAPKSTYGIKERLKGILPVAIIISAGAAIIQLSSSMFSRASVSKTSSAPMLMAEKAVEASGAAVPEAAKEIVASAFSGTALWFSIGAVSAILIYFIVEFIRNKNK